MPSFIASPLQAAGGLRTLTAAWGTVEAAAAAGLHDMLIISMQTLNFSLFLQAAGGLRTLTDAWGTVEAAVAAGLHDMLATMLAALPWDEGTLAVAYRHMPEVRCGGACVLHTGELLRTCVRLCIEVQNHWTAARRSGQEPHSDGSMCTQYALVGFGCHAARGPANLTAAAPATVLHRGKAVAGPPFTVQCQHVPLLI